MENSSIEEYNLSLDLYAAPLNSCKKVLPTSKQFRNQMCIFNTFKLIHCPPVSTYYHYMMLHITCVPRTRRKTSLLRVLRFINKICPKLVWKSSPWLTLAWKHQDRHSWAGIRVTVGSCRIVHLLFADILMLAASHEQHFQQALYEFSALYMLPSDYENFH